MQGQSLIYSNARVKAIENTLLSSEKITRMTFAESLSDAVKVLYESNYAGGFMVDNPLQYSSLLATEESRVADFMRECMIDKSGLETLLCPYDYHNTKAFLKAKILGLDDAKIMLAPSGNIEKDFLYDCILNKDYNSLSKEMADTLTNLDNLISQGNITPRIIDVELDKALYLDIMARLKKAKKANSLSKYWTSQIDLVNLSNFFRCKMIDSDEKFFSESFIYGGSINDYVLIGLLKDSYDAVLEKLRYTDYAHIIEEAVIASKNNKPLVKFEAMWDNYLLDVFKDDKWDIFSIAPLAGFYVAKKIELKMVRMILTAIKNNASESEIKARLRGFYA